MAVKSTIGVNDIFHHVGDGLIQCDLKFSSLGMHDINCFPADIIITCFPWQIPLR